MHFFFFSLLYTYVGTITTELSLPLDKDNSIKEIKGLENCHRLQNLSLAHNKIEKIQGLDYLPIQYLNLVRLSLSTLGKNFSR